MTKNVKAVGFFQDLYREHNFNIFCTIAFFIYSVLCNTRRIQDITSTCIFIYLYRCKRLFNGIANYFADEMVNGAFSEFKHEHHFADLNGGTLMIDYFDYKSPFGILGNLADKVFLEKYMTDLLSERNRIVGISTWRSRHETRERHMML